MSLENKVIVITGAGFPNGIGAGIARCFAAEKAKIAIVDLEGAPVEDTIASIDGDVTSYVSDAASQEAMGKTADQIIEKFGQIDVLVNNAGVGGPEPEIADLAEKAAFTSTMTDEIWDLQLAANLRTTYSSSMAIEPKMVDGGNMINIASVAAKAGVAHLTKTLAIQFAPRKIRVNCICPGLLYTRAWEMLTAQMKAADPALANVSQRDIFRNVVAQSTPLAEEQTPEDIGNLAVFFGSEKSRMITGAVVAVDGGSSVK